MKAGDHAVGGFVGAAPDGMGDDGTGKISDFVSGVPRSLGPVDVLTEHKKVVIEGADFGEDVAPDEKCGPADPINVSRAIVLPVLHQVFTGVAIIGEETPENGVSERGSDGVGEAAAGILERSVRVEELGADDSGFGVILHEFNYGSDGTGVDDRVAVEQGFVFASAVSQGQVMPPSETKVSRLTQESEFGEF